MQQGIFKKKLPVKLTDVEWTEHSTRLASYLRQVAAVEEEKKKLNKAFKEEVDSLKAEIDNLSKMVDSGFVEKEIDCVEVVDEDEMLVVTIRADNNQIVSVREMTDEEKQRGIWDEVPKASVSTKEKVTAFLGTKVTPFAKAMAN